MIGGGSDFLYQFSRALLRLDPNDLEVDALNMNELEGVAGGDSYTCPPSYTCPESYTCPKTYTCPDAADDDGVAGPITV